MALAPAAMFFTPSAKIAAAMSVEVVVPSPTTFARPLGGLTNHLRAEILFVVLELELLRDGHPVIADERPSPLALDENGLGRRSEGDPDRVGELRDAAEDFLLGSGPEEEMFGRHGSHLVRTPVATGRACNPCIGHPSPPQTLRPQDSLELHSRHCMREANWWREQCSRFTTGKEIRHARRGDHEQAVGDMPAGGFT